MSMEKVLITIGIIPNQFWPAPLDDGHAERVFIHEPNLKVILEVFTRESRSPLHVHTCADKFIYVSYGEVTIVTPKTCTRLKKGDGIIIRANDVHGFFIPKEGVRLISISIGPGVEKSRNRLPEPISQLFAPIQDDVLKLQELKHEARWKDLYSQFEIQTKQWVKQSLLDSFQNKTPLPFDLQPTKQDASIPLQGWRTPSSFILKVKGHSYGFNYHEEPGNEHINLNRVFTLRFAMNRSDKKIHVLK